jgi:predicted metal-dependent hydrolase
MRPPKTSLYPAQQLRRRAQAWAVKLRVNPRVIRVQDIHCKWGSCSSLGTVTLAHGLVTQSVGFQDFVIVHELLHLRFSSHGKVFKALLTAHVPGWQRLQAAEQHNARPSAPATDSLARRKHRR